MSDTITNRKKPNYTYAIFSVALVLFLLGVFGVFLLHTPKWIQAFKEEMVLMVEFKEETSREEIQSTMTRLESSEYVKPESVLFISKEEAAIEMKEELGENWVSMDISNPFFDMVNFNVKSEYLDSEGLTKVINN